MKRSFLLIGLLFVAFPVFGTVFGTVRGIVHDPQHRPVPDVTVTLKSGNSSYVQTAPTDANGEFRFDAVPLGEYRVTASAASFASEEQTIVVLSGTAPILHFEMKLGSQSESITVSADVGPGQLESITPSTLVNRLEIQEPPGAVRTNSLAIITDYVPGSYVVHDQLHVRGGHQVTWLIDGVAIHNTNIASNLGPQVDPKDMDTMEAQRGSYSADYGDRTYGIFNVAPRTGFERDNEAELVLSAGNFYQTADQLNFGGHTNRFAYYGSVNGNRTNLGLQTPTSAVIHDAANGFGGFTSLIYNVDSQDQFRLIAQSRRDFYQIPFDSNDPANTSPNQFFRDANRENDSFVTFSWVRTFSQGLMLTISPFYHYNSANYQSAFEDFPSSANEDRSSKYEGGQATLSWIQNRSNLRVGLYGFSQQDGQLFGLLCHDPSQCENVDPRERHSPDGSLAAIYAEEQFKTTSWLTLNAGLRQTRFSGGVVENASSPRVGASLRIPKLNWVFRAFYGHFYQAPPLLTVSGPLLEAANNQNLSFIPLHGERDEAQVLIVGGFEERTN